MILTTKLVFSQFSRLRFCRTSQIWRVASASVLPMFCAMGFGASARLGTPRAIRRFLCCKQGKYTYHILFIFLSWRMIKQMMVDIKENTGKQTHEKHHNIFMRLSSKRRVPDPCTVCTHMQGSSRVLQLLPTAAGQEWTNPYISKQTLP